MQMRRLDWWVSQMACGALVLACGAGNDSAAMSSTARDASASGAQAGSNSSDNAAAATGDAPLAGTAIALIKPFGDGAVMGTATFLQNDKEVSLVVALNHCPDGSHAVHIHEGTSCADVASQGAHWDMTRGEGIPDVTCSDGQGASMTTRSVGDPLAWSLGGPAKTNLVGRVFVVHDADDPKQRIGCGPIVTR